MAKFSIILPVRNGGHYVKECVASILAQSFRDFDLLVLDNESTDGTSEWIRSVEDPRVKIYPSERSLTIEQNWQRILSVPKNEFMTLIGHDDRLNVNYLAVMNELILQRPDASLYQTHFTYIDAAGEKIRSCKAMGETASVESFLGAYLKSEIDVMGTGFLMRSADYDSYGGIPLYPNLLFADFELWIEMTKKGYLATSANECFSFRIHQSTTAISSDTKYMDAFQQFIHYLQKLKKESSQCDVVIQENAQTFLEFYCQGLAHRLLRTPKAKRNGLTVSGIVAQFKKYSAMLGSANELKPEMIAGIRIALLIDSNAFTRYLFLLFKKLYSKPILK